MEKEYKQLTNKEVRNLDNRFVEIRYIVKGKFIDGVYDEDYIEIKEGSGIVFVHNKIGTSLIEVGKYNIRLLTSSYDDVDENDILEGFEFKI